MAVPKRRLPAAFLPLLLLAAFASCTERPTEPPIPPEPLVPATLEALTRMGEVEVGSEVRLVVRVRDLTGRPVPGVRVDWATDGRGGIAPASSTTDAEGLTEARWTLDTRPGEQAVSARVEGLPPLRLLATARPGPPHTVTVPADSVRLTAAGDTLRLSATARDRYGNDISAPEITWTSTDSTVVRLDSPGLLRAVGRGIARVVARAGVAADTASVYVIPRGVFTITFDDGLLSAYSRAFPILQEVGLRGNVAVNPEPIRLGWSGYAELPHLRELSQAGWSMVSHSMTHPDLTRLTDEELDRELAESAAWIRSHGFPGSTVFIVPYHAWGGRELAAVKRHYEAARGASVSPPWEQRFQPWPPLDPFLLTAVEPELLEGSFTSAAGRERLLAVVEAVIERGEFVDVFFHDIAEDQMEGFRETARLLGKHRERFRVYHELFPG